MTEHEYLEQLLADDATQGLGPAQLGELDQLLHSLGADPEAERMASQRSALFTELAFAGAMPSVPAHVEEKLQVCAERFLRGELDAPSSTGSKAAEVVPMTPTVQRRSGGTAWGWLAAAAALLLAILAWWPRLAEAPGTEEVMTVEETAPGPVAPDPSRPGVTAIPEDLMTLAMAGTEDPAATAVTGTLEWSPDEQIGWMHFEGLQPNDPSQYQYQLWIFDDARDERYPVDGGVFDVPDTAGTVDITIDPKLPVEKPTLFAVTVEPPGGVVVSGRERIVMVAPVS